jgi:hypothetical protein
MSLTSRGRVALGLIAVVVMVGGGAAAVAVIGGKATNQGVVGPTPSAGESDSSSPTPTPTTSTPPPPPPICPLTGVTVDVVPARPPLAVKVENLPAARPQTGLSWADIVYEEPVEGGITRFIAIYQCQDASRIEPVRSARLTDVDVLLQFDQVLFAYSGAVPKVSSAIRDAGIIDINSNSGVASKDYHRDTEREAPHNLYTSSKDLYRSGAHLVDPVAPDPLFAYSKKAKGGTVIAEAHLPFSSYSDVYWKWSKDQRAWLRYHGTEPHTLSDGTQVSATNVVVQMVNVTTTDVTDSNGVPSPEAHTVGMGKVYVLRNGRMFEGTWVRENSGSATVFRNAKGKTIKLAAGTTWVELLPNIITPSFS